MAEEKLSTLCDWIKRGCDAHTGITAGTFYRDEGWCFYQLGAAIECADQTTRLLDAKFLNFMAQADSDPGSATDSFYWMALLRSAAGYQAFRRRHPRGMVPEQVAAFLLSDPCFPALGRELPGRHRRTAHRAAAAVQSASRRQALQFLDEIRDDLEVRKVKTAIANGELHRFNDFLQRSFIELTSRIAGFFGQARRLRRAPVVRATAVLDGGPAADLRAMSRLEVRHTTLYRYARPVRFGPHRAMLRPRDSHDLKLRSATLTMSPAAQLSWMHDVFGNSVTLLEFTEPAAELRVESQIELQQFTLDQPALPARTPAPRAGRSPTTPRSAATSGPPSTGTIRAAICAPGRWSCWATASCRRSSC